MKLLSINAGRPREIEWQGKIVLTSIYKSPIQGQVRVRRLNIDGDQQSNLSVHGGVEKAVYAYPSEHYAFWRKELADGRNELAGATSDWGAFGENFTTEGLLEDAVRIGDRLRIGSAEFRVTQPRLPCFKLGIRFGRPDIIERFQQSGRSGFYLAVVTEGEVTAGDRIEWLARENNGITVADLMTLVNADAPDQDLLRRAAELPLLSPTWRNQLRQRVTKLDEEQA
jgi:MOSC domain-containing protein YiiM